MDVFAIIGLLGATHSLVREADALPLPIRLLVNALRLTQGVTAKTRLIRVNQTTAKMDYAYRLIILFCVSVTMDTLVELVKCRWILALPSRVNTGIVLQLAIHLLVFARTPIQGSTVSITPIRVSRVPVKMEDVYQ